MNPFEQSARTAAIYSSKFDLSHTRKLTMDMGQIIPVLYEEMVPGATMSVRVRDIIKAQPLAAPIMHRIDAKFDLFFCSYNNLWPDDGSTGWQTFLTGGPNGTLTPTLPTWVVTGTSVTTGDTAAGSLWDYLGFPIGIVPADRFPVDFPKRAYNLIYNEFFRDKNLTSEVDIETSEDILYSCWEKDYFTSALPWQQRGTAASIPITITAADRDITVKNETDATPRTVHLANTGNIGATSASATADMRWVDSALDGGEIEIAELRLQAAIQQFLELNAIAGAHYSDHLKARYGIAPRDEVLHKPVYVGGARFPIVVSEVLQNSESGTTPQGTMAGHGVTIDDDYVGSYMAKEFGILMGVLRIMPRTGYQQGIDRMWLRQTRYDYFAPEFVGLAEQEVEEVEIVASATGSENTTLFGYQGRYNEYRYRPSTVHGLYRSEAIDNFDEWHLARHFSSRPTLNTTFVECNPSKRIFAAPSEPGFFVEHANLIDAILPLPQLPQPGITRI